MDYPDDSYTAGVDSFADRLRWIIREDYEDEGASAILPLSALVEVLDAVADLLDDPTVQHLLQLAESKRKLDALR
jgi:hypothetical protein